MKKKDISIMTSPNTQIPLKVEKLIDVNINDDEASRLYNTFGIIIYKDGINYFVCNREVTPEEFAKLIYITPNPEEYRIG